MDLMSDYYQTRQHKAAGLVATTNRQVCTKDSGTTNLTNVESDFRKLELRMQKELKVFWNHTTLNSYVKSQMIPRGLRMRKNTTSMCTPEFQTQWNDALSKCSLELMSLIVK